MADKKVGGGASYSVNNRQMLKFTVLEEIGGIFPPKGETFTAWQWGDNFLQATGLKKSVVEKTVIKEPLDKGLLKIESKYPVAF